MGVNEVSQPGEYAGLLLLTDGRVSLVTKEVVGHGEAVTHLHVRHDQSALAPETQQHLSVSQSSLSPLSHCSEIIKPGHGTHCSVVPEILSSPRYGEDRHHFINGQSALEMSHPGLKQTETE